MVYANISCNKFANLAIVGLTSAFLLTAAPAAARNAPFLYVDDQLTNLRVQGRDIIDLDINDQGLIAGSYFTGQSGQANGFLYKGGIFTPLSVPTATSTEITGLNNLDTIVGNYSTGSNSTGFRYSGGTFMDIAAPGATQTQVTSVNDAGSVGGYFYDQTGAIHGFINQGDTYKILDVPGATSTYLTDINALGEATGYFVAPRSANPFTVLKPFVYSGGNFTILENPAAIDGGIALAINDQGDVAGYFTDAAFRRRGFLYSDGVFTALGDPTASETFAVDLNNAQAVIGYSTQPPQAFLFSGGSYQFVTSPTGGSIRFEAINNSGAVVGLYTSFVPEADTWLLMVLGFGVVGMAMRRNPATAAG